MLSGYQLPSGTIIIDCEPEKTQPLGSQRPLDSTEATLSRFEAKLEALQASLHQAAIERSHLIAQLEQVNRDRAELLSTVNHILGYLQNLNVSPPPRWPSEVGMDYSQLEELLASGRWREADEYTWLILLAIIQQEEPGSLTLEDIAAFPMTDLQTLDLLWLEYSEGQYGLSVQRAILESVENDYSAFCDRVGWRLRQRWLYYDELHFGRNAPPGHLPVLVWRKRSCYGVGFISAADSLMAIADRLSQLNIE